MRRRVEGDDVDVILEVLQKLVELLGAAAAVCEDLRLVGHPLGRPRLNVPQVDPPLLWEEEEKQGEADEGRWGMRRRSEVEAVTL